MFGHDDPPSRSAPTLGAPKSEGKVQPWDAQITAADPASFRVRAALTQSPPQQSRHDQDGTAQINPDTSSAGRDQTPSNRPEHTEKSRRLFVAGESAASETPAAMVIPQITTDGTATLSAALMTVEPSNPLGKTPLTKDGVRTALPTVSGAEPDARPAFTQGDIPKQATPPSGDTATSSTLPVGSARAHPHTGAQPTAVPALQADRETPGSSHSLFKRETSVLPPVRSPLDQAGFPLSSISAPATAGPTDNQLLPLQPDQAASTRSADGSPARTSPGPAITPANSSPTPTAQILPAMIAFAGRTDGSSQMTVSLHPRDLGEVEVHLVRQTDGSTTVTVIAGEAQTLQELSQNAHHLHAALDAANLPAENRTLNFVSAVDPQSSQHDQTPSKSDDAALQNQNSSTSGNQGQAPHQRQNGRSSKMASDENSPQVEASVLTSRQRWQISGLNITA